MLAMNETDTAYTPEQLVVGGNVQTQSVTIKSGAAVTLGDVLGQITATGKFIKCVDTAVDGSQTAKAIACCDVAAAASADAVAPVYVSGQFAMQGLRFDASFTTEAEKLAAFPVGSAIIVKKLGYSGN